MRQLQRDRHSPVRLAAKRTCGERQGAVTPLVTPLRRCKMAWFKVDTSFFRNKKIVNLSANAKLFYLAGLATCADQRTNGEISVNLLPVLCPDFRGMKKIRSLCEELVAAGLWVPSEVGFQVHGYLEYQRSADSIDREKEAGKKRQQQFRNGVTKNSVTVADRIDREIEREIEGPLTGDPLSLSSQEEKNNAVTRTRNGRRPTL